ncbi:MAG: hypothetical protein A2X23_09765 [Chloroflexi bacterium GWC2_73_18]|nr:MAG: hypothetical protein A2X23_09765 [Chloroflexi bacterium GWC2_73_18]
MAKLKLGILLWGQCTDWPAMLAAARRVDELGYDHLWAADHLLADWGDPHQPLFEGWTTIAAWATATQRARLGLTVGANTLRNPGLVAKMVTTIDHVSGGRAICGLGIVRRLLDGEEVSHASARYQFDRARHAPRPLQAHLPLLIGGVGERRTLRIVARHADMWNAIGTVEELTHKDAVLREHCEAVGRDHREIERTLDIKLLIRDDEAEARRAWDALMRANRVEHFGEPLLLGSPERVAEALRRYRSIGFHTVIIELPAPYDLETIERLIGEVRPLAGE